MRMWVGFGAIIFSLIAVAEIEPDLPASFPEMERQSIAATWAELTACGLSRLPAYSPQLPRPQIPADEAVVNSKGSVLAYTLEGLFTRYEFKNPNGGLVHWVNAWHEGIIYGEPYRGIIAQASRALSPYGYQYNFLCGSTRVNFHAFRACVQQNWVRLISSQLCRFPSDQPEE